MQIVAQTYPDAMQARDVYETIVASGIDEDRLSLIINGDVDDVKKQLSEDKRKSGTAVGAAAGGGLGILAGLSALALPGIGTIAATGWAATALGGVIGTALGGFTGNMVDLMRKAGISEEEAEALAQGVENGHTLLIVRADEDEVAPLRQQLGAVVVN